MSENGSRLGGIAAIGTLFCVIAFGVWDRMEAGRRATERTATPLSAAEPVHSLSEPERLPATTQAAVYAAPTMTTRIPATARIRAQPSFDCARTDHAYSDIERTICTSGALAHADTELAVVYNTMRQSASREQRTALAYDQRRWIHERDACASDEQCILRAYVTRTDELRNNQ